MKPEVSELPPADAKVVIEPLAASPNVRRAADVLRLILAVGRSARGPAGGDAGARRGAQHRAGPSGDHRDPAGVAAGLR